MIQIWIETNGTKDEWYSDDRKTTTGLFTQSGFCLLGIKHARYSDGGWMFGLIVLNIGFGLWKEV